MSVCLTKRLLPPFAAAAWDIRLFSVRKCNYGQIRNIVCCKCHVLNICPCAVSKFQISQRNHVALIEAILHHFLIDSCTLRLVIGGSTLIQEILNLLVIVAQRYGSPQRPDKQGCIRVIDSGRCTCMSYLQLACIEGCLLYTSRCV